jgi:hypothetical protein
MCENQHVKLESTCIGNIIIKNKMCVCVFINYVLNIKNVYFHSILFFLSFLFISIIINFRGFKLKEVKKRRR